MAPLLAWSGLSVGRFVQQSKGDVATCQLVAVLGPSGEFPKGSASLEISRSLSQQYLSKFSATAAPCITCFGMHEGSRGTQNALCLSASEPRHVRRLWQDDPGEDAPWLLSSQCASVWGLDSHSRICR